MLVVKKSVSEEKSNEELPAGIGDDSSCSPLVIGDHLNMVDMSGGVFFMKNHTLYQKYYDSNNGDVSSGYYIFKGRITL